MLTEEQQKQLREKYNIQPKTSLSSDRMGKLRAIAEQAKKSNSTVTQKRTIGNKAVNFLLGAAKGLTSTVKGMSSIGEKTLGRVVGAYKGGETSAEKLQGQAEKKFGLSEGSITEATNPYQKAGKFVEQVAEFAIPGAKVDKAVKGAGLATKLLTRGAASGLVATAQSGEIGKDTALAAGTEIALPLAGKALKPVTSIMKRLFVGLGSSLSGVSSNTLKTISKNPKTAVEISKKILKEGQESVLENNAKTIINGVSGIKKEARKAFGEGLEQLSSVDIKPEIIAKNSLTALEKNGIKVTNAGIDLSNSEIFNKTIQKRAKNIIGEINEQTTSDGKSLRSLMNKIESSKFKSGLVDPDRMSYNVLLDDLSKGLKTAINESTDKLKDINLKFSTNMNLAEGVEKIFGKVKFKNTSELNKVAKKLESLFSQKGLDPRTVDEFLTKINVNPESFKASEAVRSIANKTTGANTKGLSFAEITQQITSSVITPNAVKNIAIATGIAEEAINAIIKNASPSGRAIIIKSLMNK